MPIYEYQCSSCGHELEKLQKISDPPLTTCPACRQDTLRKRISAAGFRLKGGGWYETDFKKDKRRNVVKSDDGGDGKAAKEDKKPAGGEKSAGSGGDSAAGGS
jgi:putative FmdB family regulatory protein